MFVQWLEKLFIPLEQSEKCDMQKYSAPLSQYFVEMPFAASTVQLQVFWGYESLPIFAQFSLKNSS